MMLDERLRPVGYRGGQVDRVEIDHLHRGSQTGRHVRAPKFQQQNETPSALLRCIHTCPFDPAIRVLDLLSTLVAAKGGPIVGEQASMISRARAAGR